MEMRWLARWRALRADGCWVPVASAARFAPLIEWRSRVDPASLLGRNVKTIAVSVIAGLGLSGRSSWLVTSLAMFGAYAVDAWLVWKQRRSVSVPIFPLFDYAAAFVMGCYCALVVAAITLGSGLWMAVVPIAASGAMALIGAAFSVVWLLTKRVRGMAMERELSDFDVAGYLVGTDQRNAPQQQEQDPSTDDADSLAESGSEAEGWFG